MNPACNYPWQKQSCLSLIDYLNKIACSDSWFIAHILNWFKFVTRNPTCIYLASLSIVMSICVSNCNPAHQQEYVKNFFFNLSLVRKIHYFSVFQLNALKIKTFIYDICLIKNVTSLQKFYTFLGEDILYYLYYFLFVTFFVAKVFYTKIYVLSLTFASVLLCQRYFCEYLCFQFKTLAFTKNSFVKNSF